ncbi:MAG: NAD(P)H-dependent oxidoreductase [Pseudomonadota bacterium]
MSHILIINAHQPYPFSEGKLNGSLVDLAQEILSERGHETRRSVPARGWDTDAEVNHHVWADVVLLQTPVNWMSMPWSFKKYMDEVYTAGMDGRLCQGDGRSSIAPKTNYGAGGTLTGKRYLLSLTFNAPEEAFNDPEEYLFQGRSVDDLMLPMHMNFRFFGMTALPTYACFDAMKDADPESYFSGFRRHLEEYL